MHAFPTPHSVTSFWSLEISHSRTTYPVEARKCYNSELPSSSEILLFFFVVVVVVCLFVFLEIQLLSRYLSTTF